MPANFFPGLRRFWLDLPLLGKGLATVGIPVALVATGLTLLSSGTQEDTAAIEAMHHGAMMRTALNTVLTDLLTAESEARGYLVSGRFDFSARSNDAQSRLPTDLEQIAKLTNGSQDELVVALEVAVEEKLAAISAVMRAAGSRKAGPEEMLRAGEAMNRVRERLAAVEGREVTRQAVSLARHQEIRRTTMRWGVLTMVLGLSSTLGAIFFSTLSLRRRVRSMQMSVRALKMEAPLVAEETSADEIGQLQAELERTSEVMASRVEELRESEGQLRTIIDHTSAIVYIKDLESRFLMVSRAYEEIFGLDSAQVVGKRPVELFGEDYGGRLRANDLAVLKSGQPAQFEESFKRNGKVFTYLSVKAPLLDPHGVPYGICGISTAITKRESAGPATVRAARPGKVAAFNEAAGPKTTQAPQISTRKSEWIGQVAGSVAHDFNNILAAIIGHSSLLLADLDETEREESPAAEILRASERAAALTRQLLALSHTLPAQVRVVEIETVVQEVERMLRPVLGESIVVQMKSVASPARIKVDPAQISQLLLNLAVNARDAMPRGGTITIGATQVSLPPGPGRSRQGDFVAISISDQGPGIPAEVQARMYEPFYTTKGTGAGAGLGLSISNMIAQQSGGWLSCKSAVDAGATFTLYLPSVAAPVTDLPNEQLALPLGRETVLVVEDDPMVGEFEALLLRNLGYTVMRAEDGVEAEHTIATSGAIDLVLTDLRMPRMDGRELIERIGASHPGVKVILTSGSEPSAPATCQGVAVDFLAKPFDIQALAGKVRGALDR